MSDRFYNLPIFLNEIETQPGGWTRNIQKNGTVKDLLNTWNIEDKKDMSEMTQVLRHLKNACEIIDTLTKEQ